MAPISAISFLALVTVLLSLDFCDGRPQPPEYRSFFTSPTSIRVEWQEPSLDPGATVKGFRLQYKLGDGGKLIKLKLGTEFSYDIEGLPEACGDYRIRMSTASSKGLSRYTSFSQVERVASAPENLVAMPSGSSARINWDRPANSFCMTGYSLKYGPDENDLQTMELPELLNQYLLSDLQPGISYLMTIAAVADGEMSEEAYLQWYQVALPGPPANLKADPSSPESVVVMWSPTAADIERYEYLYGTVDTPDTKMTIGYVEPSSTLLELEGLEPGEEYIFKVSSVNSVGQSEVITVTWTQPSRPAPTVPKSPRLPAPSTVTVEITSASTAMISWTPPLAEDSKVVMTGYIVGYGIQGSTERDLTLFSLSPEQLQTELDGLKPGSTYIVNVQAYDDLEDGEIRSVEWIQEVPLRIPTQVRGVLTYSSSPTSITVRWLLSEDVHAEQTEGFRVTYGQEPGADEFERVLSADTDSVELDGLQPETFYYVKIYKFNAAGRSPPVTRSLETPVPPPDVQSNSRCVQQQRCTQQFEGHGALCPRILQYLNCLQTLRDFCMEDASYRHSVANVRQMFLTEGCNRNPQTSQPVDREPPVPGGFAATPVENILPEIIPPPTNLEATVLSATSALLTWVDETLVDGPVADNRFYNIRYRSAQDQGFLEDRTQETSFLADFLVPGVQYEFSVQLVLGPQRRSELTGPVLVTSRDPAQGAAPQRLTVLQIIVSSPLTTKAVFNWLPPTDREDVMEYRIEYTDSEDFQDPDTIWQHVTVDGSKTATVIQGLGQNTEYRARIRAIFSPSDQGPFSSPPALFTTPVIPPSSKAAKQCEETDLEAVTRRVDFLWDEVAQRPPLYGIPIPYCEEEYGTEECHGQFCFCIPGKRHPALRNPECNSNVPPCRREYEAARKALVEARETGSPAIAAQLPHCQPNGYYQPKQCSGTMCYCVTESGDFTGQEAPIWESSRLNCA